MVSRNFHYVFFEFFARRVYLIQFLAAAYLLISLVPSQSFRANYRTSSLKIPIQSSQRELNGDALIILHTILSLLLRLLRPARAYTDISVHGTGKLTAYFSLMTYCMITKTEKMMVGHTMHIHKNVRL